MVTQPATTASKKFSVEDPALKLEQLFRQLLAKLPEGENQQSPPCRASLGENEPTEEIIYDQVIDGAHYLLIRLRTPTSPSVQLSPREQEIVRMVAQGHPNKIIADVLNISSWTVCTHLRRIFAKLGVGSRAAMVARIMGKSNGAEKAAASPERKARQIL